MKLSLEKTGAGSEPARCHQMTGSNYMRGDFDEDELDDDEDDLDEDDLDDFSDDEAQYDYED